MHTARLAAIALALLIVSARVPAGAAVLITINKSTQQMTVDVDGATRWTWPVSTGRLGYDTPSGRYTAFRMEADHFSKEWDDAPMPHSIFFTPQGHAIHGYLDTRNIGRPASHGCVRLEPDNAAKLYALVEEEGLPNTKVVLTGDVRVALGRGTMPRSRDASASTATREPLDARSYGYPPRSYDRQTNAGYRAAPPSYDRQTDNGYRPAPSYNWSAPGYTYVQPRYSSDSSYRPFLFGR
jgi:L,D-transpeptidase catalytic domain